MEESENLATSQTHIPTECGRGALQISLHPLVIITISDHFTRARFLNEGGPPPRIFGGILGTQKGREIEIFNCFELLASNDGDNVKIDFHYLKEKEGLYKKVYEDYEILGWYSTGKASPLPCDMHIHRQMIEVNENPLYLMLDPEGTYRADSKELPVSIYESELKVIDGRPTMMFVQVPYRISTAEAERIGVDHIAHMSPSGDSSGSHLSAHLIGIHGAVKMLNLRVAALLQYMQALKQGSLPVDHVILRRISSLCNILPAIDTPEFKQEYLAECNDALLVTYLASITKTAHTMNELVDKFNILHDKQSRQRGFFA